MQRSPTKDVIEPREPIDPRRHYSSISKTQFFDGWLARVIEDCDELWTVFAFMALYISIAFAGIALFLIWHPFGHYSLAVGILIGLSMAIYLPLSTFLFFSLRWVALETKRAVSIGLSRRLRSAELKHCNG
jgi:hypothetical protein